MQISAREDIQAPIEAVFDMVSDFGRFERLAMRRGIEVRRTGGFSVPTVGCQWEAEFNVRGRKRQISVEMAEFDRPGQMCFNAAGKGLQGLTEIEFLPLSQRQTRLAVGVSLSAKTLPARLFLQSLKLGKSRFRRQFQMRLSEFAREVEARYLHGL